MWTTLASCLCFLNFPNVLLDCKKHMTVAFEYVHIKHRIKLSSFAELIQREPWSVSLYSWNKGSCFVSEKSCTQHFTLRNSLYSHRNRSVIIKYYVRYWRTKNKRNNQMWFTLHFFKIHSAWLVSPQQNTEQLPGRNVRKQEELFFKQILPYFPKLNVTLSPISTKGAQCFTSE